MRQAGPDERANDREVQIAKGSVCKSGEVRGEGCQAYPGMSAACHPDNAGKVRRGMTEDIARYPERATEVSRWHSRRRKRAVKVTE